MVEVRLHGALAAEFGKVWELDIKSPAEAVSALSNLRPKFRAAVLRLHDAGFAFRVRTRTKDFVAEDLQQHLGTESRMDIVPIVAGASNGVRVVVGAVLVVAGYFIDPTGTFSTTMAKVLLSAGVGLALGGIVGMLTPALKRESQEQKKLDSWSINGPTNTADQGSPVPIIYGEVLTGATTISAGISVDQLASGASTSEVRIVGNSELYVSGYGAATRTVVVELSASLGRSGDESTAYVWSFVGFPSALAKRLVESAQGTIRLELDYPATTLSDSGSVNVSVTLTDYDYNAYEYVSSGRYINGPRTKTTSITGTKVVTVAIDVPEVSGGA